MSHLTADRLAAAVLDASSDEQSLADAHVETCSSCAAALQRMQRLVSEVGNAALETEPPPDLGDRVFAAVAVDPVAQIVRTAALERIPPPDLEDRAFARLAGVAQNPAPADARPAGVASQPPEPTPPDTEGSAVVVDVTERLRRRSRLLTATAAGLAAALVALTLVGLGLRNRLADLEDEIARGSGPGLPSGYPAGHPMQEIELHGPGGAASAELVHFRQNNFKFLVSTDRVLPLRPGSHYEVWLVGPSGEASAGSFRLIKPDDPLLIFNIGVDPSLYPRMVITREADDGDPSRDGPVLLEGRIDVTKVHHHG